MVVLYFFNQMNLPLEGEEPSEARKKVRGVLTSDFVGAELLLFGHQEWGGEKHSYLYTLDIVHRRLVKQR